MPVVPRYGGPRASEAPLPNARVQTGAPAAAFGVPAAIDLTGVQREFAQIVQEERDKADQLAVLDADAELSAIETELLYSPETGALQRRGKDALGAPEEVTEAWQKRTGEIGARLTTDRQRLAFQRMVANRGAAIDRTLQRHVATEIERYDTETTEAYLENERNAAIATDDPDRRAEALARTEAAIRDHAARTGKPPEWLEAKLTAARTSVHLGVIDRMLSADNDRAASAYYAAHKEEIAGSERARVEQLLEQASTLGESMRQADAIITSTTTRSEAYERANAIEDPKLRQAVRRELDVQFAERDRAEAADYRAQLEKAADIVERGGTLTAAQRAGLKANDRRVLDSWRLKAAKGEDFETDWTTYYALTQMAASSDPKWREEFKNLNLLEYRGMLGDTEWKEINRLQTSVRSGNVSEAERGFLTESAVIQGLIDEAGVVKTNAKAGSEDEGRYQELRRAIDREVLLRKQATGKSSLPIEELQRIVGRLQTQVVLDVQRGRDQTVPLFLVTPEQRAQGYIRARDIPADAQRQIQNLLTSHGRRAQTRDIERAYFRVLESRKTVDELIDSGDVSIIVGDTPAEAQQPATSPTRTGRITLEPGGRGV